MTGDLSRGLSDMWRSVLLFVPTALAFIAILIIGYFLARLVRAVVAKGLHGVGFDKAVERGAIGRAVRGGKLDASDLLAKIAFYAVMLFALQLAFGIWGPNAVSDLLTSLIAWLPRAFVAIIIIVVAAAIAGAAHDLIANALGGLAYGKLLARSASILIITLGVIAALDQVQIATATIAADRGAGHDRGRARRRRRWRPDPSDAAALGRLAGQGRRGVDGDPRARPHLRRREGARGRRGRGRRGSPPGGGGS